MKSEPQLQFAAWRKLTYHHRHGHSHGQQCPKWQSAQGGQLPSAAIECSPGDKDHEATYIVRCHYKNDIIPGKCAPWQQTAYFGQGQGARSMFNYEALVDCGHCHYYWQQAADGQVPPGAVKGGIIGETSEVLYIARSRVEKNSNEFHGGQLQPSRRVAYILCKDVEYAVTHYEVLCKRPL